MKRDFTIIELLVVIAIIGILTFVGFSHVDGLKRKKIERKKIDGWTRPCEGSFWKGN